MYQPQPELEPVRSEPRDRHHGRAGGVPPLAGLLGVAVLSAVISSVATFSLLSAVGGAAPLSVSPTSQPGYTAIASGAPAAQPAVNSDAATSLVDVVARAKNSVVTITTQGSADNRFSPFSIPTTGVGSGIVVSANGLILTNYHVVEGAAQLTVATADGRDIAATVVETDQEHDIAVIRAAASDLTPATLGDSARLQVGATVLAIGSPLGEFTETVTRGIVSALDRDITVADQLTGAGKQLSGLIQTDAAINPGNSGGPLINEQGEVVGMNAAVSQSAEGIGFAIPINAAKSLIDKAAASNA
jgi:S1-C subfamily serine protease